MGNKKTKQYIPSDDKLIKYFKNKYNKTIYVNNEKLNLFIEGREFNKKAQLILLNSYHETHKMKNVKYYISFIDLIIKHSVDPLQMSKFILKYFTYKM